MEQTKISINKSYLKAALLGSKDQYQDGLISKAEYMHQSAIAIEKYRRKQKCTQK